MKLLRNHRPYFFLFFFFASNTILPLNHSTERKERGELTREVVCSTVLLDALFYSLNNAISHDDNRYLVHNQTVSFCNNFLECETTKVSCLIKLVCEGAKSLYLQSQSFPLQYDKSHTEGQLLCRMIFSMKKKCKRNFF